MTNVTNLHFELGNTTRNYDNNGAFFINWTNASDPFGNNATHNLHIIFNNGTVFQTLIATINRSFNSAVNANFTFKVEAVNGSNSADRTNSSVLWMVVDNVNPAMSYNSNAETNNSAENRNFIFVNVSASDINNVSSNLTFSLHNGTSGVRLRQNRTAYNSATANNTFNWTSVAEGKYYFNVTANDSATNSNLTDTRTFFLDSTKPTISLQSYSNATIERNTDSLTLNIFVNDSLSGLTGASCLVDVNGTNQTIALSSGWCNGTVALTGLSDGNKTIKVYANDSANNFGLNNSFVVFMDSANPTATASCSSTTIYEGDPFPCSCSGTDSLTTVTTSPSSTGSLTNTLVTGSFTYTCSATDVAGNSASESKNYIVLNLGGGGSGTSSVPTTNTYTWTRITPDSATIITGFKEGTGINQIQIEVNNEVKNVQISVTKYIEKPAEITVAKSGKVYQYLQINAQNLGNNLDKANVQFRVEKSWASENRLNNDNIAVYKFDNGRWNELNTKFSFEDATYYYYDVELDSFSYFAIAQGDTIIPEISEGTVKDGNNAFLWILIALGLLVAILWVRKQPNP